jgi:DNA modification methylase
MTTSQHVYLGDARELVHQLPDKRFKCAVVDPPYGVDFVSRRAETPEGKRFVKEVANDGDLDAALKLFRQVMNPILRDKMTDEAELYCFTRWDIVGRWIEELRYQELNGFFYKMLLVWDKGIPGMGDIDSNWGCGHELILYLKRGLRKVPKRRSGIIAVDKLGSRQHIHPTEKPVGLIEHLIMMSTDPEDWVLDPFAGSGSTLVASKRLDRNAVGFEIDPGYVSKITHRLDEEMLSLW